VEFKDDNAYRNPLYQKMDEKKFKQLDDTIKTIMGSSAVTAADLQGNKYASLGEMVENNCWPSLCSLKGKFIFLLHPGAYTDMYINMDKTLKTQMFIPVISSEDIKNHYDYAAFILHDNPDAAEINGLVNNHYIVRTFMDNAQIYNEAFKASALASGAQMLTTDLEKGVIMPKTGYTAYLKDNYTIIDSKN
jgi:hypothetical protein